jgi:hypothetical protein
MGSSTYALQDVVRIYRDSVIGTFEGRGVTDEVRPA